MGWVADKMGGLVIVLCTLSLELIVGDLLCILRAEDSVLMFCTGRSGCRVKALWKMLYRRWRSEIGSGALRTGKQDTFVNVLDGIDGDRDEMQRAW